MVRTLVLVGLMLPMTLLAGCVAVAAAGGAAVGTWAYIQGRLESTEDAPLDRVHGAALAAVEELEFTKKTDRKDAVEARVVAEKADGTDITISMERLTDQTTKVGIRVGTFGDESLSTLILETMRKHY